MVPILLHFGCGIFFIRFMAPLSFFSYVGWLHSTHEGLETWTRWYRGASSWEWELAIESGLRIGWGQYQLERMRSAASIDLDITSVLPRIIFEMNSLTAGLATGASLTSVSEETNYETRLMAERLKDTSWVNDDNFITQWDTQPSHASSEGYRLHFLLLYATVVLLCILRSIN